MEAAEAPAAEATETPPAPAAETPPEPAPEAPAEPVEAEASLALEPAAAETEPPAEAAPPPPPPYSLPFALRPVAVANVVRSDTALGLFTDPVSDESGSTIVSMLLASYKVTDELAPMVRLGIVSNSPPDTAMDPGSGFGFLNPVIGATYSLKLGKEFRLAPFLGIALPLGSEGGNGPDPAVAVARGDGIWTRSAMDNAMFAVNDLVIFPGVGFAYIANGFTAQVEATLLQLTQVRGDETAQPDDSRTNFTAGVHVGYFFVPMFSVGAELRHQRWLSTPTAVEANDKLRETTTFAIGPRFHFKLNDKMWLRPALSFAVPLDDPMADREYKVFQLDIPFVY
jgi:hypothetical protein